MSTPRNAAAAIRIEFDKLVDQANAAKIAAAESALRLVLDGTPVLTGRARRGWTVGLNKRPRRAKKGANPEDGFAVIKSAKPGEPIYIVNRLPYINRLNNGWSKKAPASFFERAVAAATATLARFGIK
jgi:hypothetical protein